MNLEDEFVVGGKGTGGRGGYMGSLGLTCAHCLDNRASPAAQRWRIRLPMQGTWVQPRTGAIPRASEQLSPGATTTEAHTP